MKNRNTILNELVDLQSSLAGKEPQNIYSVPEGYFEGLADRVIMRVKTLEASDPQKELELLSPLLSHLPKTVPYTVPVGYFGNLGENILQRIREHADYQNSDEEIGSISPLLSDLKNKNPYSVPEGYFKNFSPVTEKKETKVISITKRRWYRLAAAAVFVGIIILGGILFLGPNKVDPNKNPEKWIAKNVQNKVSSEKIDEFVTLTESDAVQKSDESVTPENISEVKELINDVPEKELEDFLNDAVAFQSNDDVDALLNE